MFVLMAVVLVLAAGLAKAGELLEGHRPLGDLGARQYPVDHLFLERRRTRSAASRPGSAGRRGAPGPDPGSPRSARRGVPAPARDPPSGPRSARSGRSAAPGPRAAAPAPRTRCRRRQRAGIADAQAPRGVDLQLLHLFIDQGARHIDRVVLVQRVEHLATRTRLRITPASSRSMLLRTSSAHLLKTTLFDTVGAEEFLVDCREGVLFDRLNGEVQLRRLSRETLVGMLLPGTPR